MLRRGPVERESLVLDATVLAALEFLSGELRRRGVEVKTDLQAGEARIWGDRVSFDQVLINLINNACDAMAAQSASPKILTLRTAREGRTLRLSVCDNGVGLQVGADEIFAPFFTTKPAGLGLGLAISLSIVLAHDGLPPGHADADLTCGKDCVAPANLKRAPAVAQHDSGSARALVLAAERSIADQVIAFNQDG
jgi:C4-dicarboxylate-specific signal transduction histidine kinase